MKSMLYVGASLMIGASIYGFVDYKQTSNKKEFTGMYDHNDKKEALVTEKKQTVVADHKTVVVNNSKPVVKKAVKSVSVKEVDHIVPAVKPVNEEELPAKTIVESIPDTKTEAVASPTPAKKIKKKKKVNHKIFSRAPLREEEEEIVVEKELPKKTEVKEQ